MPGTHCPEKHVHWSAVQFSTTVVVAVAVGVVDDAAVVVVVDAHATPSPTKPALQTQVNDPTVLLQPALAEQGRIDAAHSSVSTHCGGDCSGSHSRPRGQRHVCEPSRLTHACCVGQMWRFSAHSSTSRQFTPSPE
jgi:hypothetical protein